MKDGYFNTKKLGYLYLIIAAILLLFYNGRYIVPLAAWLWPVFLLRFIKKQKFLTGLVAGGLVNAAASIITMYGLIPLKGVFFYLVAGSMGITLLIPFLLDKLVSLKTEGFIATLALPLTWTSLEYINSLVSPFGTFGSMAYTQFANLPLVQLVSVTGIWGIIFLVTWFASVVNWMWERDFSWHKIKRGVGVYSLSLTAVLLFGSLRLVLFSPASYPLRAAAISVPNEYHTRFAKMDLEKLYGKNPKGIMEAVLRLSGDLQVPEYLLNRTSVEAEAGAKLIAWSEGAVPLLKENEDLFVKQCRDLAHEKGIYLLMTVVSFFPNFPKQMPENKNILIDPSGNIMNEYLKSVLVPGEIGAPGNGIIQVARTEFGRMGSAICFDMDFPVLIRQAGKQQTDIMLAPSSDWKEIDPVHTYIAVFRAVENGFSLIRPVSKGLSGAVDYQGRILAIEDYYKSKDTSMVCYVPVKGVVTIYSRIGDVFAWFSILGLGVLIYSVMSRRSVPFQKREP
jgi:apolipoprotein N-acyltransferase